MRKSAKYLSLALAAIFMVNTLSACGGQTVEVPELLEPVTQNEAYRQCEKGDIGNATLYYGNIVPSTYCHFWKTDVTVDEIYVNVGDYVEAGQKIASCSTEEVEKTISSLEASISLEEGISAKQQEINDANIKEMNYRLQGATLINDETGVEEANRQIGILEENKRYDTLLSEHRLNDLRQQLDKQQELLTDSYLYARVSGYVCYVKDISYSASVSDTDNLVVIADYDNCYLELEDATINDNMEKVYHNIFTYQNGEKYKLEYYDYQPAEKLIAESRGQYPKVRMKYENQNAMPECGTRVPVLCYGNLVEDVLVIGQDSLYEDTGGDYVYVKNGDDKVKTYVELGATDKSSIEVISGLNEGDMVYYASESVMPDEYSEYTVESQDYTVSETGSYTVEATSVIRGYSDWEGTIASVSVKEGDAVQKGQLICTIQTNEGGARLMEVRNQINELKNSHDSQNASYDSQIQELKEQMETLSIQDETATDTDAVAVDPYLYEELSCQIEELSLNRQIDDLNYNSQLNQLNDQYSEISSNNDGTGIVSVYADTDGTIKNINIREGKNIKSGDKLYNIEVVAEKKLLVKGNTDMTLGEEVTFTDENGSVFIGTVTGDTGDNSENYYITTLEDKVYITQSTTSSGAKRYYASMEDSSFYDKEESCTVSYNASVMKGVVLLPGGMLYSEKSDISDKQDKFYVWKLVDGEMEKYYVDAVYISVDGSSAGLVINGLSDGDILADEGGVR